MTAKLNHTIVWCRDKSSSSAFLAEILGLPEPTRFGPFRIVELANGVSLDFHDSAGEIASQHYAFLVSESGFDKAFAQIRERALTWWADPAQRRAGEINPTTAARPLFRRIRRHCCRDHHPDRWIGV